MKKCTWEVVALALGLVTACGDGDAGNGGTTSDGGTPDDAAAGSDASGSEDEDEWSVTITGLEGTGVPLPEEGIGGPGCASTSVRILCSNQGEPDQVFRVETDDDSAFDEVGEQTGLLVVSWGDPRYECISNLDDIFEKVGAKFDVTSVDPLEIAVEADVDCYASDDPRGDQFPAKVSVQLSTYAPPI